MEKEMDARDFMVVYKAQGLAKPWEYLFGRPHHKDSSILGSDIGAPPYVDFLSKSNPSRGGKAGHNWTDPKP